jgi:hypothetical protein
MKAAILCEFTGIVRDALIREGHEATSCDLLPSESSFGKHIQGDCRDFDWSWAGLAICFPPCTHLAVSGARWFKNKQKEQAEALEFIKYLMALPIPYIAVENPIGIISTRIRKPDQIIQPWMFGHGETKATCLWLFNLPLLKPTNVVDGREHRIHKMPPSENRGQNRSRTYEGIAEAMAKQWGNLCQT